MIASISTTNFWNYGQDKEDSIHRIHSYPAKFPAFITTKALQHAAKSGVEVKTIADVFCGCGTTAVESKKASKNYWGCDINPVATLIAQVKTRQYQDATLNRYFFCYRGKLRLTVGGCSGHPKRRRQNKVLV